MRILTSVLLASALAAQTSSNKFEIYPEATGSSTSYVDRMNLGGSAGEMFQEVPAKMFRGVGDAGSSCTVTGFQMSTADENGATPETFTILIRSEAAGGGPDPSSAGIIMQTAPQTLPIGTGRVGYLVTFTFATPVTLPCEKGWFVGISVAAANWTTDGQSLYMAFYPGFFNPVTGDNPRSGAPNHAWWVMSGSAGLSRYPATVRVGVFTDSAVLNLGGIDPNSSRLPPGQSNYGAGGMYPDVSGNPRKDGLDARVRDAMNANGTAVLFLANGYWLAPGGLPIGGVSGRLWLDLSSMLSIGSAAFSGNIATVALVPAGVLPPVLSGYSAHFQALTVDSNFTTFRLSNAAVVNF